MEDRSDPGPLTVAMAQSQPVCGDVRANVGMLVETVDCAQQQGIQLVVFREAFLTGQEPDLVRLDPSNYAIHPKDPRLAPIVAACARTGVAVIVGMSGNCAAPEHARAVAEMDCHAYLVVPTCKRSATTTPRPRRPRMRATVGPGKRWPSWSRRSPRTSAMGDKYG